MNSIVILILLLFNEVNSLDKESLCNCKPVDDNLIKTSDNLNKINFVNYIVSIGKLSSSLDLFTEQHKIDTHLCSGVILNCNYILTTASCFNKDINSIEYGVGLNMADNDLIAIYDDGRIPIKQIIIHEQFNRTNLENDIALIKLTESINFNEIESRPICLLENDKCWFNRMVSFQWGDIQDLENKIEIQSMSNDFINSMRYLKESNLEDISYQIPECFNQTTPRMCMKSIDKTSFINGSNNLICEHKHEHGSPLLFNEDNKTTIIGLFSFYTKYQKNFNSLNLNRCQSSIGVYTKISSYVHWIKNYIENDEICYF